MTIYILFCWLRRLYFFCGSKQTTIFSFLADNVFSSEANIFYSCGLSIFVISEPLIRCTSTGGTSQIISHWFFMILHDSSNMIVRELLQDCMTFLITRSNLARFFHDDTKYEINIYKTTFALVKGNDKSFLIQNMLWMVFKLFVYKSRINGTLNFNTFLHQLIKVKNLEEGGAFKNKQKHDMFLKKWSIVENLLPL